MAAALLATLSVAAGGTKPYSVMVIGNARPAGVPIAAVVSKAAERAFRRLPHRGLVRIVVEPDRPYAIGVIGIGAYTDPRSGYVHVTYTSAFPRLRKSLETLLAPAVAHELHHSSRIRTNPGYGTTLGEAMVSEGLADHFAEELYPHTAQPWDHALTKAQERELWKLARSELSSTTYDHGAWFFGTSSMPAWAGYTFGYEMVGRYLRVHGTTAALAVHVDAAKVLSGFRP
jgi:hypothetical protein